jgi:8-oxo-dGTP pyrophosphatase MutT (NUDIX family)
VKTSAGCLAVAEFPDGLRYLLVHPSGNYNRHAPWSLPKGELEPNETPETCALRETLEETGVPCRIIASLGEVMYSKSRKRILGFLAEPTTPIDATLQPPGSWEVDRVEFLREEEARRRLHPDQIAFLERARELDVSRGPDH